MVVYIEYVLIDNLVIDFMLLKFTAEITGKKVKKLKLCLLSVLGTAVALFYPLLAEYFFISLAVKILLSLLMVFLLDYNCTVKSFLINESVFLVLTFLTGGAIIGVFGVLGLDYSSEICIAFIVIPAYLLIKPLYKLIKYLYKKKDVCGFCFDVKLTVSGGTVACKGFLDTGNGVYDGNSPVIFLCEKLKKKFINVNSFKSIKKIRVNTVSGESFKTAIVTDAVNVYFKDEPNIFYNVTACFTDELDFCGCEVLLHPSMITANQSANDEKNDYILKDA